MIKKLIVVLAFACLLSGILHGQQAPTSVTLESPSSTHAQTPSPKPGTLDDLVRQAQQKNPAIQSALLRVQALRHRVPQAKALPDPRVSVGWMGNITPFSVQDGDPSSYRSVSVMQEVPFPGKLRLQGEIASKEADVAQWDYEAIRRRVASDVKTAYYDFFFYDRAIAITQKNKDLLEKLSKIAEARYRVGKGMQQDVLKAQTELSLLLQKLTVFKQQRSTAQARLNTLLSRNPEAPLDPPSEIQQATLAFTLDEFYELTAKNDTGLQQQQQMIERTQLATNLAKKDSYPDFSVGYMYQQRPLMPDMHGLTFTVNIPIFYKSKQREAVKEAAEETLSTQQAQQDRRNELNFEVKQQYLSAKASQELIRLYSQGVIPQSSLALESSMAAYEVGNVDFLTVLSNFSNVLQYQIDYYRELANFQSALARLEPLVGVELTSSQPQDVALPENPRNHKE